MLGRGSDAVTDVIEARRTALEDLCQRHGVARHALFGSALRDDFDPDTSDLDLVEFSSTSPSEHAGAYFGLLEDLEDLFARRVDLVEIGAPRPADKRIRGKTPVRAPRRLCVFLGSSASGGRTLERQKGDVVFLLPALPNERVKLP